VQNLSAAMVVAFTLFTVVAVAALQGTEFRIARADLAEGLAFRLPADFTTAFAAFGIIGVGASELIYYPYWCLAKGYAHNAGAADGSPEWIARIRHWVRVMRVDAWLSLVIYTVATVAFYLLGAAVLGAQGKVVTDDNVVPFLSEMYTRSYGELGLAIFLFGGFCVLYSTVFAATASNARLLVDGLAVYRLKTAANDEQQTRFIKVACVALAFASLAIYLTVGKVVLLVFIGALTQGLMLPFLAGTALYFRYRHTPPGLRPGLVWTFFLWVAAVAMATVGSYQVTAQVLQRLN
jgi:Mn2+/Fe2+ NRAMP family transporter